MHEHVLDACQQGHEAYIGVRDDELSRQGVQDALETGIAAANDASAVIDESEALSASNTRDVQTAAIAGELGAMAEWFHQGDGVRYAESYAELEDLCEQAFAAEWRD